MSRFVSRGFWICSTEAFSGSERKEIEDFVTIGRLASRRITLEIFPIGVIRAAGTEGSVE